MRKTFVVIAIALTLAGIAMGLIASPRVEWLSKYESFCAWDCRWYKSIAETGYHSPWPPVAQEPSISNVAFFPGYPLLARPWIEAFDLASGAIPLLMVSQVFCVLFWIAILLMLDRWRVARGVQLLVIAGLFTHPAAFYLVTSYSESTFLASMLFYFYFADHPDVSRRKWAILPGFLMTATRIVGLPIAAYPLFRWALEQKNPLRPNLKSVRAPLGITALASLGTLSFFAYCHFAFGDATLYMLTQKIGWGLEPDYGALWKWSQFVYITLYERNSTQFSAIIIAAFLLIETLYALLSRKRPSAVRFPLYLCVALIFYITLCGLKGAAFRSMIRYTLPWTLLLLLCLAQLSTYVRWERFPRTLRWGTSAVILAAMAYSAYELELRYFGMFLHGWWFA